MTASERAMIDYGNYFRECLDNPESMHVSNLVTIEKPCVSDCHVVSEHAACDEDNVNKSAGECAGSVN